MESQNEYTKNIVYCKEKVCKARYCVVESIYSDRKIRYCLEMHLIKPYKIPTQGLQVKKDSMERNYNKFSKSITGNLKEVWKVKFSKEEIVSFTTLAGDENFIHKTKQPIVPGLLFLKEFFKHIPLENQLQKIEMQFHSPTFSNELVTIYKSVDKNCYFAFTGPETQKRLAWELKAELENVHE